MSMSTHVFGILEQDAKWKKMKAVWDACTAAGIDIPREVSNYFGDGGSPAEPGQRVEIDVLQRGLASTNEWWVQLDLLPPGVKFVVFQNSY